MNKGKYIAPFLALLAMLPGCATNQNYPIAQNFRDQSKPLAVWQVRLDPEGTQGATVIWGGIIVNTVNGANGGAIYVMEMPLDPNEKPRRVPAITDQFIATSSQPLDPESFSCYGLVTVAGKVVGVRTETQGGISYIYPVVEIEDVRTWPIFEGNFMAYGTPGRFVGPNWWWYGGMFYPPRYDGGFCKGYDGEGSFPPPFNARDGRYAVLPAVSPPQQ